MSMNFCLELSSWLLGHPIGSMKPRVSRKRIVVGTFYVVYAVTHPFPDHSMIYLKFWKEELTVIKVLMRGSKLGGRFNVWGKNGKEKNTRSVRSATEPEEKREILNSIIRKWTRKQKRRNFVKQTGAMPRPKPAPCNSNYYYWSGKAEDFFNQAWQADASATKMLWADTLATKVIKADALATKMLQATGQVAFPRYTKRVG